MFSYRLLIATTDKLHHIARRTIDDQEKQVAFVGLSDLLTSEVNWRTNPLDMRPSPPPKPAKPSKHQREAIRDVVKGFTNADRGQLIMACGTGKTLTSLFIKEKLDAERTLVLVPSLSLLKQTMQVWRVNATVQFDSLPVCSDDTVRSRRGRGGRPHQRTGCAGHHRSRRDRCVSAAAVGTAGGVLHLPVLPADRRRVRPGTGARVRSGDRRRGAPLRRSRVLGFRHGARRRRRSRRERRLFMTATPRYFTGRVLKAAQEADFEVASMDDEAKFGTVFHRLDVRRGDQTGPADRLPGRRRRRRLTPRTGSGRRRAR